MQASKSNQARAKTRGLRRRIFTGGVAVVGTAGLAAAVMLPAGTALAAYQAGPSPDGSSVASVSVGQSISLTDNTPAFSVGTGVPGDSLLGTPAAASLTVYTNNLSGYNVTVTPVTDLTAGATDTIPVTDLSVKDTATANTAGDQAGYLALNGAGTATTVYSQATRSAVGTVNPTTGVISGGDTLTESWEFNTPLPDVNTGTYSTTIDFIASANS